MVTLKNQAIQTALSGDWQKAVNLNKSLIEEDPSDIDALNRLAFALTILGKIKDAKSAYQKVLKIDSLNSLAVRSLKKLDGKTNSDQSASSSGFLVNNSFIEEQGKTKIVELVNIAQPSIINNLRTGQSIKLSIKRLKIFALTDDNSYVGVLPDNIGKRLIKFIKAGNIYDAFVKSAHEHHVIVFLKEVKKLSKFKDQPSFLTSDKLLVLDKKLNKGRVDDDQEEPEEE
ncbi:MAG: tetratricopeptide repeat protein [Patescibacteria group bacterium]